MILLAFDQAPKCIGYAYGEPGAVPVRGLHTCNDYGENTARLGRHVREFAVDLIKSSGAVRVYFEQILVRRHGLHMPTLWRQFKVASGIETAAELCGLEDACFEIDIADWRREFYRGARPPLKTDSQSEAWKDMARRECARRGWLVEDHNVAEACGIWFYGCLHSDPATMRQHKIDRDREQHRREREAA